MAKIDLDVDSIKQGFKKALVNDVVKSMTALSKEQDKLVGELDKLCNDHLDSDFNSVNVGSIVTKPGKLNIDSLQIIHTALFEIQGISSVARVKIYPKLIDLFKSAVILYNRATDEIMNSNELAEAKSNAEKERIKDYILLEAREILDNMRSKDSQAESYISYIKDQMYHLNSLDTMIRTADKMEASEVFTESLDTLNIGADKKTFNKDGSVEDDTDLDELKDEEVKQAPKSKTEKKSTDTLEDLEDLDDLVEI